MLLPFLILPHTLGQGPLHISNQSCCSTMVLTLGEYEYNGTTYDFSAFSEELMYSSFAEYQNYTCKPRFPFDFLGDFCDFYFNQWKSEFFLYSAIGSTFGKARQNYYFYTIFTTTYFDFYIIARRTFNCGFRKSCRPFKNNTDSSKIENPNQWPSSVQRTS